ncbi:PhzF family phenazine biosynthesis protein [Acuticoccus sp. M5D2P5]|uniref:PhzF family phenazine biosynthesis protein n=1 Tax=Acuticoccus kalidii TaxID=2910977 RepID=UPI001F302FEA|nr:PhzF family phenazine biosynthesis protein [Acuticoccus kalidii]MCF3932743.1 PhzF family phenazine biosynthesis protein [Acuticoccus kalidii]
MPYPYQILDVFTEAPLAGNPLAVVYDADGLDTEHMFRIAAEFNLSETIFIRAPADPANDVSARIFTPKAELPFAGHPTVGAAVALARRGVGADGAIAMEVPAGLVRARVDGTDTTRAAIDAPLLPKAGGVKVDPMAAAAALGLHADAIGFDDYAPTGAFSGPRFTVVPVKDATILGRIALHHSLWHTAFAQDWRAVYVVARRGDAAFQTRMFAPEMGVEEDPATGSAAVAFAAVFAEAERPADGAHAITITQGMEMGRPSELSLLVEIEGGKPARVELSGAAVVVAEGTLLL